MSSKPKIHFHSDCEFFGGSENMLEVLFNSSSFMDNFRISFSYRYSKEYESGMKKKILKQVESIYPLKIKEKIDLIKLARRNWLYRGLSHKILFFLTFYKMYKVLKLVFKTEMPDVIHINSGGYPGAVSIRAAVLAAKKLKIPSILVVNNLAKPYSNIHRIIEIPLDILVSKAVNYFITGSNNAREQLIEVLRLNRAKCKTIPNGIIKKKVIESRMETVQRIGIEIRGKLIIGMIANFESRKGHLELIQLLKKFFERNVDVSQSILFIFEGQGILKSSIADVINKNKLTNQIKIIKREEYIGNIFNLIDVLILPSVSHEDLPNVISEAMSFAKPVFATRIGGIPEQIEDGVNGFLFDINNYEEFEFKLRRLVEDQNLVMIMGKVGYQIFEERYRPEIAVAEYKKMYIKAMNRVEPC